MALSIQQIIQVIFLNIHGFGLLFWNLSDYGFILRNIKDIKMNFIDIFKKESQANSLEYFFKEGDEDLLYRNSTSSSFCSTQIQISKARQYPFPQFHKYTYQFPLIQITDSFSLYQQCSINNDLRTASLIFMLMYMHIPFRIQHSQLRIELCRFLNKINCALKGLFFVINLKIGLIYLKTNPLVQGNLHYEDRKVYIQRMRKNAIFIFHLYLNSFLDLCNLQYLQRTSDGIGSRFQELRAFQKPLNHPERSTKDPNYFPQGKNNLKNYTSAVELLFHKQNLIQEFENKNTNPEQLQNKIDARSHIYSLIHIYNMTLKDWEKINQSNQQTYEKKYVEYSFVECLKPSLNAIQQSYKQTKANHPQYIYAEQLVMKSANKGYLQNTMRERAILKRFRNKSSPFVCQFFQSSQSQIDSRIFLRPYKSLSEYLQEFKTVISISTKLRIATHLIMGLDFLKQEKIVHMDIQPKNIIVGKGLIFKISNFEKAYYPSVSYDVMSLSFPYGPPEFFDFMPIFTAKSDMFSFGMTLMEIFYGQSPVKLFRYRSDVSDVELKYTSKRIFEEIVTVNPYRILEMGQKDVIRVIMQISVQCVNSNQFNRPESDLVTIILKELSRVLQKI